MKRLSTVQFEALIAANTKGPLKKTVCGWTADGMRGFASITVDALRLRGLLAFEARSELRGGGKFHITGAGLEMVNALSARYGAGGFK